MYSFVFRFVEADAVAFLLNRTRPMQWVAGGRLVQDPMQPVVVSAIAIRTL